MADELLNTDYPKTWFGERKKICGFVDIGGQKYCFLGRTADFVPYGVKPAEQIDLKVTAFTTEYTFSAGGATLKVKFVSPLLPDDIELLSLPVCYMEYELTGGDGEVSVLSAEISHTTTFRKRRTSALSVTVLCLTIAKPRLSGFFVSYR